MRSMYVLIAFILFTNTSYSQKAQELISNIIKAQSELKHVSYTLQRIDTFTSGDVWNRTGKVEINVAPGDKGLGFYFWGKRDDMNTESIYDGHIAYAIDHNKKNYDAITKTENIYHILGSPGGQMVFKDLIRLDTSKAISIEAKEEPARYILKINYPDNSKYDITNRYKILYIDKKSFLPTEEFDHLVALNKVQDNHFKIQSIEINQAAKNLFNDKNFLTSYAQEIRTTNKALQDLVGKEMPGFSLSTFTNEKVSANDLKGKAVLLDFWAIWCGPCIASMPKVEELYKKYKNNGLAVYGVMSEEKDAEPAKLWNKKHPTLFPMLIGNESLKQDYKVNAIPLYILIDKNGKIIFVSEGFSEDIEAAIKKVLQS